MPCHLAKISLILLGFLLFAQISFAQNNYKDITIRIDSLADIGLPQSALKEVGKLDSLARKNNDAPQIIRVAIYRITFLSYLEENSFDAIITQLKVDIQKAAYPEKPFLQSLLGEMYWRYYENNRWRFAQRSALTTPDDDFKNWDLRTIIEQSTLLYKQSLTDAATAQQTSVSTFADVLAGDKAYRYLRPTLYDLLLHRALDFFLSEEPALSKPRHPFSLNDSHFFSDSKTFASLTVDNVDSTSTSYQGIKYLQDATRFHLKNNNQEALADLDLKRLSFLYLRSGLATKDSLYLRALSLVADAYSDKPVGADAQLLIGKYYQQQDSLKTALFHFEQALTKHPQSIGGKNAQMLISEIKSRDLSLVIEDTYSPDRPMLARLEFKNVKTVKSQLYQLSEAGFVRYQEALTKTNRGQAQTATQPKIDDPAIQFLRTLKPIRQQQITLPPADDYRNHATEFKMDGLKAGIYVLLLNDEASADSVLLQLADFRVSGLAYISRQNADNRLEMRVMNRETGKPVNHALIRLSKKEKSGQDSIYERGYSNSNGLYKPSSLDYGTTIQFIYKKDTLVKNGTEYNRVPNREKARQRTILFSDRQIYRPGQTLYYKGLQMETFENKSKILPGEMVDVQLEDNNGQTIGETKLKTNEFGTFSGSFIIPQNGLSGELELSTDDGGLTLHVEEYKRPTFTIRFDTLKGTHRFNDSIRLTGKAITLSGYGLSNAGVAYHVTRSRDDNSYYRISSDYRMKYVQDTPTEIVADTILTDSQGNYTITFKALPADDNLAQKGLVYNFQINADVTDGSGETRSANTTIRVGKQDLSLSTSLPNRLTYQDTGKFDIRLNTLNGQNLKGTLTVTAHALEQPGQVFKNRLWNKPDLYLLSKNDYRQDFDYAYADEDNPKTWKRQAQVLNFQSPVSAGREKNQIDLKPLLDQKSGLYNVMILAKTEQGDTVSHSQFIEVVNQPTPPVSMNNWVIPIRTQVDAGQEAEIRLGTGEPMHVLMEIYKDRTVRSSRWLDIKNTQSIKIPMDENDKNLSVQFLTTYKNQQYTYYQNLQLNEPAKTLQLRMLSFRNKLLPGQKEEWKMQVSGYKNEKAAAEMVAGLYDASLDQLVPGQYWGYWENDNRSQFFRWNSYNFINGKSALAPFKMNTFRPQLTREYETLNLFGYNYFGSYNSGYRQYLKSVEERKAAALFAEQSKNGYEITGTITDASTHEPLIGVSIMAGNFAVGQTQVNGQYKIKVPANSILNFQYIGYRLLVVEAIKAGTLNLVMKEDKNGLNEVVIRGYASRTREMTTGSSYVVNGYAVQDVPIASVEQLLQGKVAGLNIQNNSGSPGMRGATNIRGYTTITPLASEPVSIRSNFNETAFFYPHLRTDENGEILISFTMPESLTRWKFRAFAHTKDLATGSLSTEVVTQKQLSVTANMPRFLREDDTLTVSARVANLSKEAMKGKVELKLFNAVNMQPVAILVRPEEASQPFDLAANSNNAVSFQLIIPAGLDALTYRITAVSDHFSDGEENTLPVLSNQVLVTESMPMMVRPGENKTFTFEKFVNQSSKTLKNKTLTLEYTQNPAWYAVQSMPYLMEFPYECTEQIFSRYYANSFSTAIVNRHPKIKQVFEQWKASDSEALLSNLEKNQELKSVLLEETPWLRDATNETEQKKRIALLFDLNNMGQAMELNLDKLQKKQLPNGAFPWFGGTYADRYITQHILAGIGQLYHLKIADGKSKILESIRTKALDYLDAELLQDELHLVTGKNNKPRDLYNMEIHAWYTRSYFPDTAINEKLKAVKQSYLAKAGSQWKYRSIYEQGMIALTLQRSGKPEIALQIIRSLLETAKQSQDLGMYWAGNRRGWFWYEAPIETQSLLIELFTEAGNQAESIAEMKIWLLRNKQTTNWRTTKATAAACYALLMKDSDLLTDASPAGIKLDGQTLSELKPEIKAEAGTGYLKTTWADEQIKPALGKVAISNNGKIVNWGALHWQYTEKPEKITATNTDISIKRKYFIEKAAGTGTVLTPVDAQHQPKTGDLLKVVVYLQSGRDFEYVHLKDLRPSGTEPVDVLSAFKYQDGLYYYQATKDVATNFFISRLNKGSYVFEYRLRVVQPGNFATGITTAQSMYAPEFNAHTEGGRMGIVK